MSDIDKIESAAHRLGYIAGWEACREKAAKVCEESDCPIPLVVNQTRKEHGAAVALRLAQFIRLLKPDADTKVRKALDDAKAEFCAGNHTCRICDPIDALNLATDRAIADMSEGFKEAAQQALDRHIELSKAKTEIASLRSDLKQAREEVEMQKELTRHQGIVIGQQSAEIDTLKQARKEAETWRMKLSACDVAALGSFTGCVDEYKSPALEAVLKLRSELASLKRGATGEPVAWAVLSDVDGSRWTSGPYRTREEAAASGCFRNRGNGFIVALFTLPAETSNAKEPVVKPLPTHRGQCPHCRRDIFHADDCVTQQPLPADTSNAKKDEPVKTCPKCGRIDCAEFGGCKPTTANAKKEEPMKCPKCDGTKDKPKFFGVLDNQAVDPCRDAFHSMSLPAHDDEMVEKVAKTVDRFVSDKQTAFNIARSILAISRASILDRLRGMEKRWKALMTNYWVDRSKIENETHRAAIKLCADELRDLIRSLEQPK